jgi:hypothetical protein
MNSVIFISMKVTAFSELFNRVNYLMLGTWNLDLAGYSLVLVSCLLRFDMTTASFS